MVIIKNQINEIQDINNLKDNIMYRVYSDDDRYLYSFICHNGSSKYKGKENLTWSDWFYSFFKFNY
jgi:hypothetical protein